MSVRVRGTLALGAAGRSVRAPGGLGEVASMAVGDGRGPVNHPMRNGWFRPLSGGQVEAQDVMNGGDPVAPGDLLAGGIVSAVIGDRNLVDPAPLARDFRGDLGLKAEAIRLQVDV